MKELAALLLVGVVCFAQAVLAGTPDQAKQMVERVAEYLHQNGEQKTFAAVNDKAGPFRDGDLYVFIHDSSGMVRAHGGFPSYIGTNTIWARDLDGNEFVREITEIKDTGWIEYKWLNPVSMVQENKLVYVLRVGDLLICSGAYRAVAEGK